MKSIFFIILFFSSAVFASEPKVKTGSFDIKLQLQYATLEATVACVVLYHPRSEGEEMQSWYFVNNDEFQKHNELLRNGYSVHLTLEGGRFCDPRSDDNTEYKLKHVGLGLFDDHGKRLKQISDEKAAVKGKVIYFKRGKFNEDLRYHLEETIDEAVK